MVLLTIHLKSAKATEKKIRYCRSANEGFEASLTKAVRYATGDIICLLDADDYFLPNKINEVLKEFKRNEKLLFLYHDKALIDKEGKVFKEYHKGGNTSTQVFKRQAARIFYLHITSSSFIHCIWQDMGIILKKNSAITAYIHPA